MYMVAKYLVLTYIQICTYIVCVIVIVCMHFVVITRPPENRIVCRGSNVNISCGYQWSTALPVTWIINGISFTEDVIMKSSLYRLNNCTSPPIFSLTVFSINDTTTFRCIIHSTTNVTSTLGIVTVTTGK